MKTEGTLKRRISRTFLLQAAAISLAAVVSVLLAAAVIKHVLVTEALRMEAEYFWERHRQDPASPLPDTRNLQGFLVVPGRPGQIPEALRDLSFWIALLGAIGIIGLLHWLYPGAALGLIAVVVRQEIVFIVMAGVFVMETVSVILQVASFKLTGKRIFRMAPVHHHFELKGWPEPRVIVRFWIVSVILVLAGLATLKIR